MNKIISETLAQFEQKQRGEENIIVLKQDAPEGLRDSVREAHGDRLPDDWIYRKYYEVLDALSGYTLESADDLEEQRAEVVDGLVDVYTSELTAWLNQNVNNVYYIDEARKEYGADGDAFQLLTAAQYAAIDEIAGEVISYLQTTASEAEFGKPESD